MNGIDDALLTLWPPALGLIVQERALKFFVRHHPLCVYPLFDVTISDQISQAFPLHICKHQILEVGMAWDKAIYL